MELQFDNIFLSGIDLNSSINLKRNLNLELGASYTYSQDLNKKPVILIPPLNTFQKSNIIQEMDFGTFKFYIT